MWRDIPKPININAKLQTLFHNINFHKLAVHDTDYVLSLPAECR